VADSLTTRIKRLALDTGAVKAGVASVEALAGPPTADVSYVLPGARSVVSFLVVEPEGAILKYLSKEDPSEYRNHFYENIQTLGHVGLGVAEVLRGEGFRAVPLSPNGVYEPGSNVVKGLIPAFSHRYAAVAAGLGAIGWSGNVMTPEYGARVYLSSVITDAELDSDQPLDENPCDRCNICLKACPGVFMSWKESVSFTLGGRTVTHAKRGMHARCAISCGAFTGLSVDRRWSSFVPSRYAIPEDDGELLRLLAHLAAEHGRRSAESPDLPSFVRLSMEVPGYDRPGILARSRHDTIVACGNCAIVCFETLQKRAKALRLLLHSGVVVEDEEGRERVVSAEESKRYRAERAWAAASPAGDSTEPLRAWATHGEPEIRAQ
jgi:epoxyqueuosine reductase